MKQLKTVAVSFLFSLLVLPLSGQKSAVYFYGDNDYLEALELYEKEKYGAAQKIFGSIMEHYGDERSEIRSEAQFYHAMCAVELLHENAEALVYQFIRSQPASPHVDEAAFRLADYFYDKNSWPKAISWYNRVDRFKLNRDQLTELHFKRGFSSYRRKDYEAARVDFYEILDTDSPYTVPAVYYYSHIHYTEGNYETALMGFRRIQDDPDFSSITPYYIAQILYMQKKYDEVIEFAPALMDSVGDRRLGEMAKIIGESYFMLEDYKEAIPFLEVYQANTGSYTIPDRYQLAFAYYRNGEYEKAGTLFEQISYRRTEIAQSALYHLADCYLQMGEKNKARIAFSQASKMDFDFKIQQDALFNYAKLTYELSYNPFNEAIQAFEEYIRLYPASENTDEAYNYLVMAYLSTRNYSMAMESLEKIKVRDETIEKAYQKVAFYRGLELYKNLRFNEAVDVLERSLKYAVHDPVIAARTYFWLGEAAYRSDDPETARIYYKEFLDEPLSHQQEEYALCHYSLGYIHFDEELYDEAINWFTRYEKLEKDRISTTLADCYIRLADCHFVKKSYWESIAFYDRAIEMNRSDVDYAMFQKGFTLGLLDRPQSKVEILGKLVNEQPNSNFVDDAMYEIARTYIVLDQSGEAKRMYENLIVKFPNSSYVKAALNQLGLIDYNAGNYDAALEYYEKVTVDYPGTPEANNALTSIKNIYVRKDNIDGYLAYVKKLGRDITLREQDSLTYVAAENTYTGGDCKATIASFKRYISEFPNGAYLLNAHYYKADCQLKLGDYDEALESLNYIISQSRNMFTEPALVAASKINFGEENYHRAIQNYQMLIELAEEKNNIADAWIGLMRSYYEIGEYSNVVESARRVLKLDKLQEETRREAWFKMAKSFQALNEVDFALEHYRKVAYEVNTREGAESKYRVAEILFEQRELEEAEKVIFEFIEQNTPHQYWMGMSFLLLSDLYLAREDTFQAIHTLQSIIDYYTIPDDGIIDNAKQRHDALTREAETGIAEENEELEL
ncbi:MAG: tetratricopeptide repeat protein [Bacteroidales bacterium]|nr:tetratricopeptide repeat protein [Bacteroidales bacterium]